LTGVRKMKWKRIVLQICYWMGIIINAVAAAKLSVLRYIKIPEIVNTAPSANLFLDEIYATGESVALMFGWSLLLLWASRRPIERKGVLLLTAVPVVVGFIVNTVNFIVCYSGQTFEFNNIIGEIVLLVIFTTGYFLAGTIDDISAE